MLWKATDQKEPSAETRDVTKFGWEVTKGEAVRQWLNQMFSWCKAQCTTSVKEVRSSAATLSPHMKTKNMRMLQEAALCSKTNLTGNSVIILGFLFYL